MPLRDKNRKMSSPSFFTMVALRTLTEATFSALGEEQRNHLVSCFENNVAMSNEFQASLQNKKSMVIRFVSLGWTDWHKYALVFGLTREETQAIRQMKTKLVSLN